ncbi:hypothetical protein GCM10009841_17270 [Microlunatus panaciterrae]|uniref:Uncharacterized protein n=2 Tax=Microlunatus panaciterrae TaxID=400768 RepID=A0ABS2RMR1_9ACTN|nr:hypothetical protein [Microlunatus panaciterrae]
MTTHLNALIGNLISVEAAARTIVADDVAHHVLDPDAVLGLDPLRASELETGLAALLAAEREGWALGLPVPGSLLPLRGPRELNEAALEIGQVVIATTAELALVPYLVGRGVQWRVFSARRPFAVATPYEAERALNEAVLSAARVLSDLDVAAGSRPRASFEARLAPGYGPRQLATADRALRLLLACDAALADDGGSISSFEAGLRSRELRRVREAASHALCAACSWVDAADRGVWS